MDEEEVYFSFAKNGDDLGVCFQEQKSKLDGQAMFPHILTKNTSFEVNFGARVSKKNKQPLPTDTIDSVPARI